MLAFGGHRDLPLAPLPGSRLVRKGFHLVSKLLSALVALVSVAGGSARAQTLYAATGSNAAAGVLYTINPANGVATTIGPITVGATAISMTGLAFSPITGTLYGATSNDGALSRSLVTINPATGAATLIGGGGTLSGSGVGDISFDNTGVLYGWQAGGFGSNTSLGIISLTTGVFTPIGPTILSAGGNGLAFSPVSPFTPFLAANGANGALRTVNKTTGVTTVGPTLTGAPIPTGVMNSMAVNSAGVLFAANSDRGGPAAAVNLVTINTTTGVVTNIGVLPPDTDGIAFQIGGPTPPPTPAPSTLLLSLSGLACLALYRFRGKFFPRRSEI
jgi:hypothetical protein